VKNHYELLGVSTTAHADEIKRAFRREIARYHPDKVQHLGLEFQEIAASRAAELTEAYRVLMDVDSRRKYDDALQTGDAVTAPPSPKANGQSPAERRPPAPAEPQTATRTTSAEPADQEKVDRRFHRERATTSDFVRKAAIAKLRDAVRGVSGAAAPVTVAGFDIAYVIKPRKAMFRKSEPPVRLLARFVPQVDGAAVEEAWPLAARSGTFDGVVCLMLLGSGLSPARELGAAVAEQRRRARTSGPVIVPVDVRDWEALFPPEAPDVVRQLVHRLQKGP
jgi:DnaJ domain